MLIIFSKATQDNAILVMEHSQEPVQDLDQWMQCKAKVDEKAKHTGVCEHFEFTFNAVMRHSTRS
jgi:hypothetical protein